MVDFKVFVKRFSRIKPVIEAETKNILVASSEQIIKMIQDQHHAGVNRDNKKMQSGYSKGYAKRRKKKGLQTGFVDLHFTGKYHDTLKIEPVKDGVDIQSTEPYAFYLRGMFPGMAGVTPKHAEELSQIVADILAPRIEKFLVG